MSARVLAGTPSSAVPDDLRSAAKAHASPKILRLLDGMALAAYVAGLATVEAAPPFDRATGGVMTVTNWDPNYHAPELEDPVTYDAVVRHYCSSASPVAWLRKMGNNGLCHLAVSAELRGPNLHFTGRAPALASALFLADRMLARQAATTMLVVAFDAPAGEESAHEPSGRAAAVLLGPSSGEQSSPWAFDGEDDVTAVAALDACLASTPAATGMVHA